MYFPDAAYIILVNNGVSRKERTGKSYGIIFGSEIGPKTLLPSCAAELSAAPVTIDERAFIYMSLGRRTSNASGATLDKPWDETTLAREQ